MCSVKVLARRLREPVDCHGAGQRDDCDRPKKHHPELYMAHRAAWKRMKICHPERRAVGPKSKDRRRVDSGGASTGSA
jgi:hypothetical protein